MSDKVINKSVSVTVTHSLSLLKCEYHKKCDFQTDVGQSNKCIISTGDIKMTRLS